VKQPKLRFLEFSHKWKDTTLGEVAKFENGKAHENSVDENGRYVLVNSKFISSEGKVIKYSNASLHPLSKGNVVMVMSDVPNGKALAKSFFIDKDNLYTLNQRICALIAKKINNKYLYYYINRNKYFLRFDNGVGQTNLKKSEVLDCPICCPSIEEQNKIASFFSLFDQKIEKQQEKIGQLELFKKGMLQKFFSQEIRFKDENGREFPKWRKYEFGSVVTNKSSKVVPQNLKSPVPCIELENILSNSGRIKGYFDSSTQQSTKNLFEKDSVLFGKLRPYLKKYWYSSFSGICSSEIWVLKPLFNGLSSRFLYYLIQTENFQRIANISTGSKMPRADWDTVSQWVVTLPTKSEQEKIASYFTLLENKIEAEQNKLESLKQLKKGFMQQMFI